MAAEQRRALEQLMGADTLQGFATTVKESFQMTDARLCPHFIVGTCPSDLFNNTKGDLGPCPKLHSEQHKKEWEEASEEQRHIWGLYFDYLREFNRLIQVCDGRIRTQEARLELTPDEINKITDYQTRINELRDNLDSGLTEIQTLLEMKMIWEMQDQLFEYQQNQYKLRVLEQEMDQVTETGGSSGHQKLQLCNVCGAYLSRLDNDRRLADHFYGKMHVGYKQMREEVAVLKEKVKGHEPPHRDLPREYNDGGYREGGGGGYRGGRGGGGRGRGGGGRGRGRW